MLDTNWNYNGKLSMELKFVQLNYTDNAFHQLLPVTAGDIFGEKNWTSNIYKVFLKRSLLTIMGWVAH